MFSIHRFLVALLSMGLIASTTAGSVHAEASRVDRRLGYQGQILGVSGSVTVIFEILSEGTPVWGPEAHIVHPDESGHFSTLVGSTEPDLDQNGVPDLDELDPEGLELQVAFVDASGQVVALGAPQPLAPAFHATTASRLAGPIATGAIADASVTSEKLAEASVTGGKLVPGALGAGHLAGGALTGAHITDGSMTGSHLRDGTLRYEDLAFDSLDGAVIADDAVGAFQIHDHTIDDHNIAWNTFFRRKTCSWSGYLNAAGDSIDFTCADGQAMSGLYSTPSGNDRRFQVLCCTLGP